MKMVIFTGSPTAVVTNHWSCNAMPKALWFLLPSCLQVSGVLASAACLTVQNSHAGLSQEFREHFWVTSLSHCTSPVLFLVSGTIVLEGLWFLRHLAKFLLKGKLILFSMQYAPQMVYVNGFFSFCLLVFVFMSRWYKPLLWYSVWHHQ